LFLSNARIKQYLFVSYGAPKQKAPAVVT